MHNWSLLSGGCASTHSGHQHVYFCAISSVHSFHLVGTLGCNVTSLGLSEKKEKCHRDGIGSHLQVGNPRSTGAVQDMGMLEKGKIHIDRLLSWNSYRLLESPAILLEPV